jgi:hypothetical protein
MRLVILVLTLLLCQALCAEVPSKKAPKGSGQEKGSAKDQKSKSAKKPNTQSLLDPDSTVLVGVVDEIQVVICAVVRDEDPYIDEWIQYNKFLGFTRVLMYDINQNASTVLAQLPEKYGKFVRVQHFPQKNAYRSAYFQCARPYIGKRIWAAFIDVDEFIVLRKHKSIKEMLVAVAPYGGAVSINRYSFGSSEQQKYAPEPVLSRFQTRATMLDAYVKTIAYIPHILRVFPHFTVVKSGQLRMDTARNVLPVGNTNRNGTDDVAVIHHYHTKSFEEFKLRQLSTNTTISGAMVQNSNAKAGVDKIVKQEFERIDQGCNLVRDPRALDFFLQSKAKAAGK